MKLLHNILYLSFDEVVELCAVSETYLKKALSWQRSGKVNCWQHINDPEDKRKVLISYDSLKPKYQELVQRRYGPNPYTFMKVEADKQYRAELEGAKRRLASSIITNPVDEAFFVETGYYTDIQCAQLARACAWLQFCNSITGKKHAQDCGFPSKEGILKAVLDILQEEKFS